MDNYAVIESGSRQYLVKPQQVIRIEKIAGEAGSKVIFDNLLSEGGKDVTVEAEIQSQLKDRKITVFKKKRRKGYKKKQGHRQNLTELIITKIGIGE